MLSQLFYWLLSMSVNGAAAGVLVLLLCKMCIRDRYIINKIKVNMKI